MSEANKPAYPVLDAHLDEGLTKREYYAAKAMQGLCAYHGSAGQNGGPGDIADRSFEISDAMLSETERHNDMLALVERVESMDPEEDLPLLKLGLYALIGDARRILGRSERQQTHCGCINCNNIATHTWQGNPTCDDCATPMRKSGRSE